jgi:hypothetical protein
MLAATEQVNFNEMNGTVHDLALLFQVKLASLLARRLVAEA